MSSIDNTPTNLNYLSPLNFTFLIKKTPHVNFFVQSVNIPRISLREVEVPNQFVEVPYPGEHLTYTDLEVSFKVDEQLKNYLEIHNWIRALGKPTDFKEYAEIQNKPLPTGDGIYSDITVSILSNIKTINYDVTFIDAFPTDLSGLSFKTTDTDVNYLEATATFKYSYYNIAKTI